MGNTLYDARVYVELGHRLAHAMTPPRPPLALEAIGRREKPIALRPAADRRWRKHYPRGGGATTTAMARSRFLRAGGFGRRGHRSNLLPLTPIATTRALRSDGATDYLRDEAAKYRQLAGNGGAAGRCALKDQIVLLHRHPPRTEGRYTIAKVE